MCPRVPGPVGKPIPRRNLLPTAAIALPRRGMAALLTLFPTVFVMKEAPWQTARKRVQIAIFQSLCYCYRAPWKRPQLFSEARSR